MSVFVYDPDVLEKMHSVEQLVALADADAWLERQRVDAEGPCTFLVYRNEWERTCRALVGSMLPHLLKKLTVHDPRYGDVAIYGAGGYHRYCVEGDGEVVFLGGFAMPETRARAEAVGFKVI